MNLTVRTQGLPDGSHPEKEYVFWVDTETGVVEIPWDDDPDEGSGYGKEIEQDSWCRRLSNPKMQVSVFGHFELIGGAARVSDFLRTLKPFAKDGLQDWRESEGGSSSGRELGIPGKGEPS